MSLNIVKVLKAFKAVNFSMSQSVHVSLLNDDINKIHVVHLPTVQQNIFHFCVSHINETRSFLIMSTILSLMTAS